MGGQQNASFAVTFRPNAELITLVRRFVHDFYEGIIRNPDLTSRVALATHELLENAVKYALSPETTIRVELEHITGCVFIRTWNMATSENIATLQRILDTIDSAVDPFIHYQELVRQTIPRTSGSGLGLVRIKVEAEMMMSHEVVDDGIAVTAHAFTGERWSL